jgi:hypothetical protein
MQISKDHRILCTIVYTVYSIQYKASRNENTVILLIGTPGSFFSTLPPVLECYKNNYSLKMSWVGYRQFCNRRGLRKESEKTLTLTFTRSKTANIVGLFSHWPHQKILLQYKIEAISQNIKDHRCFYIYFSSGMNRYVCVGDAC